MNIRIFLLISTLFFSISANSKVRFVRAMFNINASNSITVAWDQFSGDNPEFYFDTIIPVDLNFTYKQLIDKKTFAKGMHNHFVRLSGLKSNTRYYFCIKDSEGYSMIYYVSTVPNSPEYPLSLIAGGDSRDHSEIRRKANLLVGKLKPHAVLFNGDFTGLDLEKQWLEWFDDWELTITEDGRITPLVVTRGNHEMTNRVMVDLFDVPNKKVFYNTTFGGTLLNLVSLNSEIQKVGRQKIFLRNTLKEHDKYVWQIMQYHRPIRAHVAAKKEMETEYRNFVPLFEKYDNVRLCLENDSHTCKTTWPILQSDDACSEEGFVRDDDFGITYVGEGCWGAPLRAPDDNKCWTRNSEAINQFNWIFVSKEKIEVRTIKYENSNVVESLTEENRFMMPANIDIWNPSNGAVIEIFQIKRTIEIKNIR
jgi:hypothetical protein